MGRSWRKGLMCIGTLSIALVCVTVTSNVPAAPASAAAEAPGLAAGSILPGEQEGGSSEGVVGGMDSARRLQEAPGETGQQSQRRLEAANSPAMAEMREKCLGAPRPFAYGVPISPPEGAAGGRQRKFTAGIFASKNAGRFVTSTRGRGRRGLGEGTAPGGAGKEGGGEEGGALANATAALGLGPGPGGEEEGGGPARARRRRRGRRLLKAVGPPLQGRCSKEKQSKKLRPGEELLQACLSEPQNCQDVEQARQLLMGLAGIRALDERIACLMVNKEPRCKATMNVGSNPETGKLAGPSILKHMQGLAPRRDLQKHKTCALVGNGPGMRSAADKLGEVIDRHDAVFKFNLYNLGEREGKMSDANTELHGTKSTFRIFNKKRSQAGVHPSFGLRPAQGESWLWWHMGSGSFIKETAPINPSTYFYSPAIIKWMVDVYFKMRSDLYRLGMAGRGFDCPVNLPSGVHSVLLAMQMCDTINLFGFSFNMEMLRDRADGPSPRVSSSHSWAFDTTMLQILALTGKINICTV